MGKFTQYKVALSSLPDGAHTQDFEINTEFFKNMENPDILSADVKVHLDLVKKHEVYDCLFTLKGLLKIPCDRCLSPMDHEVDTTYHITVKYGDEYNDESDDLLVIPSSNQYLNVAYMLYDTLMLTIPLRHVHPLGKCNRAMLSALSKHSVHTDDEEINAAIDDVNSELSADTDVD
ncbi:MAG: DUF177 domain-containing protein [Muribaculaceae bacterium]|nr:DUF177 domain-containing protein [Bacteroidales bacterium]MDE6083387.1 DUF177 domain-containing protein [Muribaculaceae bacterium]